MKFRALVVARVAGVQRRVPWGVALTFDDAPSASTHALLDRLRELDVRATFFLGDGEAASNGELARRLQAEGHGVGSHAIDDLVHLQLALGHRVRLHRPAHGRLDGRLALAMRSARLDSWLWTVDAQDLDRGRPVRERDVIRLHDEPAALEVVPGIVDVVRGSGLDLVAL